MAMVPRLLLIDGYEITDVRFSVERGFVETLVKPTQVMRCHRCDTLLGPCRSRHPMKVTDMPIMTYVNFITFFRRKGYCETCKKIRSERVHFISSVTPHLTAQYVWWLSRLAEIAPVSSAAHLVGLDKSTLWRIDFAHLKELLQNYEIPAPRRISVDEVYAYRKPKNEEETRDDRFLTIVTDLDTKRVIWVAKSRRREALDEFFTILGDERKKLIRVVAIDQHRGYFVSVLEHCPQAAIVWDKFHLLKSFGEAVNEARKTVRAYYPKDKRSKLTDGKYRFIFLKRAERRSESERQHMDDVWADNKIFAQIEIIKERMLTFFDAENVKEAQEIFTEIGRWILDLGIPCLKQWYVTLRGGWNTVKNYFEHRVTSALAEGVNNVIKAIKRRSFGFRNMDYFRLKIMAVCGYLNSKYLNLNDFPGHRIEPAF
jgi:transposase